VVSLRVILWDEAIKVMEESDKDNSEDIISIRVGGGSTTP
jgi:hypothetical protein